MKGIDFFLSQSLELVIRKNLGKTSVHKIEKRLFEKYGISLTESLTQFHKLDSVLREHFGAGADGLEEEFFKHVCIINPVQNQNKYLNSKQWLTLNDSVLVGVVLESFGDIDKKKILISVTDESKIIYDILQECNIPQTSGYRKINSLIKNGLLFIEGFIETSDGKKINKYQTIFNNININIVKDKVTVDIQINEKNMESSSIILAMNEL